MKRILFFLLLVILGTQMKAQTLDTVRLVQKARKFRASENILLMFEVQDTVDAKGKKMSYSRSYYFDEKRRMLSSVREYHNPGRPEKGTQVIYSFSENKLRSVTVIPSRSACRNCSSEYFFSDDSVRKNEREYKTSNPNDFISKANAFRAKLPTELPWGFFENEIMVNGEMKKLKAMFKKTKSSNNQMIEQIFTPYKKKEYTYAIKFRNSALSKIYLLCLL